MTAPLLRQPEDAAGALNVFLVAVEESGDRLGGALMRALRERAGRPVQFSGVGGHDMAEAGLESLHAIDGFSIIGVTQIPARLPRILRHMRETKAAVLAQKPDVMVIIDSPGYSLRLARSIHKAAPNIPIVDYVSPSVWAWRSGRARAMRGFIDHVLALLPFEPDVHKRLGGPPCTYVGHPLIEQVGELRPNAEEAKRRLADPPVLLVFPGSRTGEIQRHGDVYGETVRLLRDRIGPIEVVVPTTKESRAQVAAEVAKWPVPPRLVTSDAEKRAAFRIARVALAKSGTSTLELALAGVPMVAGYKVSAIDAFVIRRLVRVPSYILANLVLDENVVPEIVQEECTPDRLADALVPLFGDTPERRRQIDAFARLDAIMEIGSRAPAARAADIVLSTLRRS
jgi:lipid-A-disaccharide synthase